MRLIFVNRFFFPDESATSLMLTDLAFSLEKAGFERHVVASRSHYAGNAARTAKRDRSRGVVIHRLPSVSVAQASLAGRVLNFLLFYLMSFTTVLRLARRGDLVVCLTDPPLGVISCLLAVKLKRARLVNWIQDVYPETATRLGYGSEANPLLRWMRRLRDGCWRESTTNVVIGQEMARFVLLHGASPMLIRNIPNWADEAALAPLSPIDNPLRERWGYVKTDCIVGYSGNLGRAHDSETMLRVINSPAVQQLEHLRFLFIGGGAKSTELEQRLGSSRHVQFHGYQPREFLRESLSVPDIHWLSLDPQLEGLIVPSKFYGAVAVGRPVIFIGDPKGEVARLIAHGECGRTFAPGASGELEDYLLELIDDAGLRERLGQNARAFSEQQLARDQRLAEWKMLLDDLAHGSGGSSDSGELEAQALDCPPTAANAPHLTPHRVHSLGALPLSRLASRL